MSSHLRENDLKQRLAAMSLEEKLGQLTMVRLPASATTDPNDMLCNIKSGRVGSILDLDDTALLERAQFAAVKHSRLGIPLLFGLDILHGYETIFPIPLAEACAFDPKLWQATARAAAEEAAASGLTLTFAPMVDVARDPRWGRMAESPGEDPWLASQFAAAKVRGFQGLTLADANAIAAAAKHFVGYGAVTAGRDYASADISDQALREVYLPPFRSAAREGVGAMMTAFIDVAGVPMTANKALIEGVLRRDFGFQGIVISDLGAIPELIVHGVAKDMPEAAALALNAGVDIDMGGSAYLPALPAALERKLVREEDIDRAVIRVLALKHRLGLFDRPFLRGGAPLPEKRRLENRALAREAAAHSIVLLKNRDGLLPLRGNYKLIVLIGPFAVASRDMLGPWPARGKAANTTTFFEGLKSALPGTRLVFFEDLAEPGSSDTVSKADLAILCVGEPAEMAGEASSRGNPGLPEPQIKLANAVLDLGKPTILALTSGRPLIEPSLFAKADAVLATWFLGSQAGDALADVLTGAVNPSGKLAVSWPAHPGQLPIFYRHTPSGRPGDPNERLTSRYLDIPSEPLFPFGHGLSYAQFAYRELTVSPAAFGRADEISIEAVVENTGSVEGTETVFLFIRDLVATVTRPVLELRGISKLRLRPGESGIARFILSAKDFSIPAVIGGSRLERGEFELFVGPRADRTMLLKATVEALDDHHWEEGAPNPHE